MNHLVLLIGPPGSGKSTFAGISYPGYTYINQDTQGKQGHLDAFNLAVSEHQNIIVDRMNFSKEQRERYTVKAREMGYVITFHILHVPREVCLERCFNRKDHPTITNQKEAASALNTFFTKYERPLEVEAHKINFIYPEGDKPSCVVVDLDGTLCNITHRLHHVQTPEGVKKNWKGFFQDLNNDVPHAWCKILIRSLAGQHQIVYASGRPDDHKAATKAWLQNNGCDLHRGHLYMRPRNDFRQDYIAKEIILDFEILTRFTPLMFIDDRKQVVDLWRSRGFVCLQCDNGEF